MFVGTAMSVHLLVYAGLSLFIIGGSYVYMVVCVLYAYNLTLYENSKSILLTYWGRLACFGLRFMEINL